MAVAARSVIAETLDGLAADDPAAVRSRGDLRRLHRLMGTRPILLRALGELLPGPADDRRPLRVLELGAGDGSLLLGVARALAPRRPAVELTLLDRLALVDPATVEAYAALGWRASTRVADVFDWAAEASAGAAAGGAASPSLPPASSPGPQPAAPSGGAASTSPPPRWDLIVANLFLHHFEDAPLAALLAAAAGCCDRFLACEPRRGRLALAASRLVGAVGANAVTREDAVLSVRAGFRGGELSALWPQEGGGWRLRERAAGLFSHCFSAERADGC